MKKIIFICMLSILSGKLWSQVEVEINRIQDNSYSNVFPDGTPLFVFINKATRGNLQLNSTRSFVGSLGEDNVYQVYLEKRNQEITISSDDFKNKLVVSVRNRDLGFRDVIVYEIVEKGSHVAALKESNNKSILNSKWKGHYNCSQGKTRLNFEIKQKENEILGYFTFYISNSRTGKYSLKGAYDERSGVLTFEPHIWINRPTGYLMVGLSGRINEVTNEFTGRITHSSCQEFYLKKEN